MGFLRWFDHTDLMCALAPTPLLITEGGVLNDHQLIRKAYALQDARAAAWDVEITPATTGWLTEFWRRSWRDGNAVISPRSHHKPRSRQLGPTSS